MLERIKEINSDRTHPFWFEDFEKLKAAFENCFNKNQRSKLAIADINWMKNLILNHELNAICLILENASRHYAYDKKVETIEMNLNLIQL